MIDAGPGYILAVPNKDFEVSVTQKNLVYNISRTPFLDGMYTREARLALALMKTV